MKIGQATRARAAAALCFVTVQGHSLEPITVGYMVYGFPDSFPDLWGGEQSFMRRWAGPRRVRLSGLIWMI